MLDYKACWRINVDGEDPNWYKVCWTFNKDYVKILLFPLCSENYLLSLSQSFTLVLDILTRELIGLSACGYTLQYKIQKMGSFLYY